MTLPFLERRQILSVCAVLPTSRTCCEQNKGIMPPISHLSGCQTDDSLLPEQKC